MVFIITIIEEFLYLCKTVNSKIITIGKEYFKIFSQFQEFILFLYNL